MIFRWKQATVATGSRGRSHLAGGPGSEPGRHCRWGERLAGPGKRQHGERQIAPHPDSSADFHTYFNTHPKHAARGSTTPSLRVLLPQVAAGTAAPVSTRAVLDHNLFTHPHPRASAQRPRARPSRPRSTRARRKPDRQGRGGRRTHGIVLSARGAAPNPPRPRPAAPSSP